ncbi:MAG: hypothetical protein AAGF11_14575 [Myxococcota bacterium]
MVVEIEQRAILHPSYERLDERLDERLTISNIQRRIITWTLSIARIGAWRRLHDMLFSAPPGFGFLMTIRRHELLFWAPRR